MFVIVTAASVGCDRQTTKCGHEVRCKPAQPTTPYDDLNSLGVAVAWHARLRPMLAINIDKKFSMSRILGSIDQFIPRR